ncbi:DUF447 domain-containing protein [Haloplanus aerogenes]|uniref:DUF447 family protein n=1 Tax=Haloplanus aerogenes TaxID=660522 RepID=A0A3M0DUC7_9EURY|nr:DUF447 domain-containing protein [Haloplanus aerogenes]AZH25819.1 DUF447 family protein [Haloplanus aerogenes]RMB25561.1 hypothetical protein ATH50_0658 [Haloplanus aerogenes]
MSEDRTDDDTADWPVTLRGVTESVVATLGPNDRWNQAALGLHAPDDGGPVTAVTWGKTRTRGNFERRGAGVIQFTADPREFVDAALDVIETDEPVRDGAAAWVEVDTRRIEEGEDEGTEWVRWALHPRAATVRERTVPTINRGFYAVIDATVAASRLDVPAFDTAALLDRLAYFADTVERCGGPAEREAFARIDELTGWRERRNESF